MSGIARNCLVNVWRDTKRKCLQGHYGQFLKGTSTTHNENNICSNPLEPRFAKTHVKVINEDAFSVARKYVDGVNKVVTLNHANATHVFGGVEVGARAQEEDLARMSNYFMWYGQKNLPIKPTACVYTTNVCVVKDENYNDLAEPFYTNMMAFAALCRPTLKRDGTYNSEQLHIMRESIHNMFRVPYQNGDDTLILGAWGCGAFGNPPEEVSKLFKECVEKYDRCFKNIVFAVLSRRDNNFDVFNSVIGSKN